jgi:hypothetical protein
MSNAVCNKVPHPPVRALQTSQWHPDFLTKQNSPGLIDRRYFAFIDCLCSSSTTMRPFLLWEIRAHSIDPLRCLPQTPRRVGYGILPSTQRTPVPAWYRYAPDIWPPAPLRHQKT